MLYKIFYKIKNFFWELDLFMSSMKALEEDINKTM